MAKSAHAGGEVKTMKFRPVGTHNSGAELLGGRGPKAGLISPVGKAWGIANHGTKAGTIDQKGNK